jgi:hypothetical protein
MQVARAEAELSDRLKEGASGSDIRAALPVGSVVRSAEVEGNRPGAI